MANNNREAGIKTLFLAGLVLIGLFLLVNLIFGGSLTMFGVYGTRGTDFTSFAAALLLIVVKLLWLVFAVSLVIGLILLARKYLGETGRNAARLTGTVKDGGFSCPCCGTRLTVEFKFCPNCKASLKENCKHCGRELQVGWKCCPLCGTERVS